ncbi:Ig-like domain-containing protein [Winogradskyella sp. PE311]|uniref:Ig-like domain-containing protein n=1 Tax=Winogradskyella sp. PE311 TaxID=3366943 RepID=UPI0039810BCD
MKTKKLIQLNTALLMLLLIAVGCERDISDDATESTFPNTADIFTDAPVGLTDDFFKSFDPAGGANTEGFGTDDDVSFEGTTSIRIDVPAPNDPNGGFIGGIFKDRGAGRNLTGYDALTFWAKGSTTGTIGEVGFGTDFEESNFAVTLANVQLSTDWRKYTIPIPDPSLLTQEKGMFLFSAGTQSTNGFGFTFWIDELRFENLGTLGQPRPQIFNGEMVTQQAFSGSVIQATGLGYKVNLASGINQTVSATPNYFNFISSDPSVATISNLGEITVLNEGTTTITASISGVLAEGSLTLEVSGPFEFAPAPTRDASSVISLFSDAYVDVDVSRYNSFFAPFQTTLGGVLPIGDQAIISYTDLNFVGIVFNGVIFPSEAVPTIDATGMTHMHIDINVQEELQVGDRILLELTNYGATNQTGGFTITSTDLATDGWVGFDIPLDQFAGLVDRSSLGLLLFNSQIGANPTISNVYFDNIYFYNE